MNTLVINRDMLGQFWDWRRLLFFSISFFLLLPKPSLFSHITKSISEKKRSWNHSPLNHRDIWAPSLELISKHYHRWELQKDVEAERNTFCIATFSFPVEIQNCLNETTIPDLLTVGLLWNFDMWFGTHFLTSSTLGLSI